MDDRNTRNIAVKQILDCIMYEKKDLDLSHLGLKDLPDLRPLTLINTLKWGGNDDAAIRNCLEMNDVGSYRLKDSAYLPDSLKQITISAECLVDKNLSMDFYCNDNFLGEEHKRQSMVSNYDDKIYFVYINKYSQTVNEERQVVERPPGRENTRFIFAPTAIPIKEY